MSEGSQSPRSPRVLWGFFVLLSAIMVSAGATKALEGPTPAPEPSGVSAPVNLCPQFQGDRLQTGAKESFGRLPFYFIENRGQVNQRVKYYEQGRDRAVFFTPVGLEFAFLKGTNPEGRMDRRPQKGNVLREARQKPAQHSAPLHLTLSPVEMSPRVQIAGRDPLAGEVNYLRGPDPQHWRTGIPTYGAVAYLGAYPGIDLKFYGAARQLEYDVIVHPGADPKQVSFQIQGSQGLEISPAGDLKVYLPDGGSLIQKKPVIYQVINGARVPRQGGFKLTKGKDANRYSFEVASYDKKFPLIIDPVVLYSTYLGGASYDTGNAIAVDNSGNAYITGCTFSSSFPTQGAYDSGLYGPSDVFVSKLSVDGSALVYSTYLGGNGSEEGYGIAVDGEGNAYVAGYTDSSSFPTRNPYQSSRSGSTDAFLTKLNAAGNALMYSTYLGEGYDDAVYAMAVDKNGYAYVTGESLNPYSLYNVFTARFDPNGGLVYRVVITGSNDDSGYGIAADQNGNAYVIGETQSPDFFTTAGAIQSKIGGGGDAFVTKFGPTGAVLYSTYLGGGAEDTGYGITVDGNGCAHVAGTTYSGDFPLKNPFKNLKMGNTDAFAAKLNAAGTALVYSTYLGGDNDDEGFGIALNRGGVAYVTGSTSIPVADSPGIFASDILMAMVSASGNATMSYFGGSDDDWGNAVAVDNKGIIYLTGETWSKDLLTKNPYQGSLKGDADAFVMKIQVATIVPIMQLLLD